MAEDENKLLQWIEVLTSYSKQLIESGLPQEEAALGSKTSAVSYTGAEMLTAEGPLTASGKKFALSPATPEDPVGAGSGSGASLNDSVKFDAPLSHPKGILLWLVLSL